MVNFKTLYTFVNRIMSYLNETNVCVGDKLKTVNTISSGNGILYRDTIVVVEAIGFNDKDLRVKDPVGGIWYLSFSDVEKKSKITVALNR